MEGRRELVLAWFATGFTCLYFAWAYYDLLNYTKFLTNLFGSIGVELPAPTRFVMTSHFFLYPLLFIGAGTLVIAKELFIRDKRYSLFFNLVVVLLVAFADSCIRYVFIHPLQDLVRKIG